MYEEILNNLYFVDNTVIITHNMNDLQNALIHALMNVALRSIKKQLRE